ncbi:MAG: transcription elongation factor GreAB [Comamonadaceae bacterium]|nr:MAG: transcription elongation factor GreAB [Comamonadaceae bacterium]
MEVITPVERVLTQIDHVRLKRLVSRQGAAAPGAEAMQDLLDCSDLVPSPAVPPNVLTMYTQVLLQDVAGGEPYKLTLCYPDDAEPAQGFVSVLSPVGTSLLGLRVGEVARWGTPGGQPGAARIVSVLFQPEASGDYIT